MNVFIDIRYKRKLRSIGNGSVRRAFREFGWIDPQPSKK